MWRAIVLGKLIISIVVSVIVSYLCFRSAAAAEDWAAMFRWGGLGLFFALLTVAFSGSLFLLHYRKPITHDDH